MQHQSSVRKTRILAAAVVLALGTVAAVLFLPMACTVTVMEAIPPAENGRLCATIAGLETARSPWDPRAVPGIPFTFVVMCVAGYLGVKMVQHLTDADTTTHANNP